MSESPIFSSSAALDSAFLFLFFLGSLFLCRAVIGILAYTSSSEKNYHDLCPKYDHPGDRILARLRSIHSFIALI